MDVVTVGRSLGLFLLWGPPRPQANGSGNHEGSKKGKLVVHFFSPNVKSYRALPETCNLDGLGVNELKPIPD
jgi:hypothetical protein